MQLSLEFFPPKTPEGEARWREALEGLAPLAPAYCSVTYGAGGSTRERTAETVFAIQARGLEAAPHISCIGASRESIRELLRLYAERGIRRLVALRGDLPSGMRDIGEFRHASDLVAFIRAETGRRFHVEVACYPEFHPQAPDALTDLRNFRTKVEAGADGAITQYFYNADAYFRFVEDCRRMRIGIPIVPGIMPITQFSQLARFSDACGAEIPRWLRRRMEAYGDDAASIRALGEEVVTRLCERLLEGGAPGLHFYTMNRAEPTLAICRNLGLAPQAA
ncbi:methylenetetrahydrofolate reductase [NAD(P)H] [Inmirania thermothiophila]|uniref:Methylenetetrahydrofolate reductase n=1 Tax=Inmirania thermothiophila TaxID=1750597 RepID=A0A3N1Y9U3_9GAMM|nr:methylenetetrahydrofolate reductase [NAD(P)H] [Inmirania thermothiophila]ROR34167.1 5,10-methylenetetrahydrofolate reductase (NAD(P)) [Inmirania thermothiophila]